MRRSGDRQAAFRALERLVGASGRRYRVKADGEGWPIVPGKHGQVEWHDGREIAVFTRSTRIAGRLLGVPGVKRHQTGDEEIRVLVPSGQFSEVCGVIRARRKRPPASVAALRRAP